MTFVKVYARKPGTDEKAAYFGKLTKSEGGKWEVTEQYNEIEGVIKSIEHVEREWKGKIKHGCSIIMQDGMDTYKVDCGFNDLLRSILNSVASVENFSDPITIRLYINKAGYAASYLEQRGERISWKYSPDDQPKVEWVEVGDVRVPNDKELLLFYKKVIVDIASKLSDTPVVEEDDDLLDALIPDNDQDDHDDDLPF